MKDQQIILKGIKVPYKIVRSSKRKTIGLQIKPDQGLLVRCTKTTKTSVIEKFIGQKANWVLKYINQLENYGNSKTEKRFITGEQFLLNGIFYTLKVIPAKKTRIVVDHHSKEINFFCLSSKLENYNYKQGKITDHYKYLISKYITNLISNLSDDMKSKITGISIRSYKRRWGSANNKGRLSFNWKLIMAEEKVMRYVIIHELCHLFEMNHSKKFWNHVSTLEPSYKEYRKWLKRNGAYLDLMTHRWSL